MTSPNKEIKLLIQKQPNLQSIEMPLIVCPNLNHSFAVNKHPSLISQQPRSLSPSVKTFRPELYQLTFDTQSSMLNKESDYEEDDISENEMFPAKPENTKQCTVNSGHNSLESPEPVETYIIFDSRKSLNGQVKSSRELLMSRLVPGTNITNTSERCCCIM